MLDNYTIFFICAAVDGIFYLDQIVIIYMRNQLGLIWPGKINNTGFLINVMDSERGKPCIITQICIMFLKKIEGSTPYLVLIHRTLLTMINIFYMEFSTYAKSKKV